MQHIKSNSKNYKILTPDGFKSFDGICKQLKPTLMFIFDDESKIRCTYNHRFLDDCGNFIHASDMCVGQQLCGKTVIFKEHYGEEYVYDPINVEDGNIYISNNLISHNCAFQGSSYTLISSNTIANLSYNTPIFEDETTKVFQNPIEGHTYIAICDPAEGVLIDYTAISVIDVTTKPYNVVMTYRSNSVSPELLPDFLNNVGKRYNDAWIICEINKFPDVPYTLYMDHEYSNVIMVTGSEKGGQEVFSGMGGGSFKYGLTMSVATKRLGCSSIKQIIENNLLTLNDSEIIQETSVFIRNKTSFAADDGYHDDLMMTLVIFGWLVKDEFFKEISKGSERRNLYKNNIENLEVQLNSIFVCDGTDNASEDGMVWTPVNIQN